MSMPIASARATYELKTFNDKNSQKNTPSKIQPIQKGSLNKKYSGLMEKLHLMSSVIFVVLQSNERHAFTQIIKITRSGMINFFYSSHDPRLQEDSTYITILQSREN